MALLVAYITRSAVKDTAYVDKAIVVTVAYVLCGIG